MVSLMAVTNRKAAERIQVRLLQYGIQADLQSHDPSQLVSQSVTRMPINILVAEADLARAREILSAQREGA